MGFLDRFQKSNNPLINERRMDNILDAASVTQVHYEPMTVQGAINKSFILFGILVFFSLIGFSFPHPYLLVGGAIAGLITVVIASFKPQKSSFLAPLYAAFEGLFVGAISARYAFLFEGIVFQAVLLTFSLFFFMLMIYKAQWIKVTDKFRTGVVMATGAVAMVYLVSFVLSFFGIHIPFIHEGGTIGILFSAGVILLGCFNLLLDFDNFETGEARRAPSFLEWFYAMGLIVTLVWLYIEILRLLAKLSSRD